MADYRKCKDTYRNLRKAKLWELVTPYVKYSKEFNKVGLNMQNVKTTEDFKQSFQLIDHYIQMKESCFDDSEITSTK